ncbi:hypothetical protein ACIRL2_35695 [Embleya sp. NPDC127516]
METDEDRTLVRVVQTCHGFPSQWNAWTPWIDVAHHNPTARD